MEIFISGLRSYKTSFCFYISRQDDAYYECQMKDFTDAVYEGLPEENPGALAWEWYRVTTPEGTRFYPFAAHANLHAWKERVTAVASEKATPVAYFDDGKFRLSDGRQWAFGDLRIDRLEGGKPIPHDW